MVYEHFGGKEGLYTEVVDGEVHALLGSFTAALSGDTPRVLLEQATLALLTYVDECQDGFRILVRESPVTGGTGGFASIMSDVAMRVFYLLAEVFTARGVDPSSAPLYSQALVGQVALVGQWWLMPCSPGRDEVAAHLVNLAWNGLAHLEVDPVLVTRPAPMLAVPQSAEPAPQPVGTASGCAPCRAARTAVTWGACRAAASRSALHGSCGRRAVVQVAVADPRDVVARCVLVLQPLRGHLLRRLVGDHDLPERVRADRSRRARPAGRSAGRSQRPRGQLHRPAPLRGVGQGVHEVAGARRRGHAQAYLRHGQVGRRGGRGGRAAARQERQRQHRSGEATGGPSLRRP